MRHITEGEMIAALEIMNIREVGRDDTFIAFDHDDEPITQSILVFDFKHGWVTDRDAHESLEACGYNPEVFLANLESLGWTGGA